MKKKKITQDKVVYFFNYVFLTLMLLIVLYPLIYIVSCSFSSGNALVSGKVKFLPVEPTLQSYKAVFEYSAIWVGYKNSIIYTVLGTLLSVALTLLAAYPLSREDLRGGKVFMALFLFTMMFSGGARSTFLGICALLRLILLNIRNHAVFQRVNDISQIHHCGVMRCHYYCQIILPYKVSEELHYRHCCRGVKLRCRLIGKNNLWRVRYRSGDCNSLLFTA